MGKRRRLGKFHKYCPWIDEVTNLPTLETVDQLSVIAKRAGTPWACAIPDVDRIMVVFWNEDRAIVKIGFESLQAAQIAFMTMGMEMRSPAKGDYGVLALFFGEWGW